MGKDKVCLPIFRYKKLVYTFRDTYWITRKKIEANLSKYFLNLPSPFVRLCLFICRQHFFNYEILNKEEQFSTLKLAR